MGLALPYHQELTGARLVHEAPSSFHIFARALCVIL